MARLPSQLQEGNQEPVTIQLDPKCLHSTLKEFFDPLRTNDSRADFFTVYRRESGDFDRDYAGKYDGDLNTALIFAGLFSAVSATFVSSVQPKLEPDPNEMTAVYMQILIHTMNNSLFPDVQPSSATWTGPPREIVIVQSLLYASLVTSLFAAFLAMLGKQWVSRYLRNRGGSAADKSRDRQRKLDGLEKWHFYIAIEGLPVMLQLALFLLGSALSLYLWSISRTVAGVIIAFTLFGATSYVFFTFAATLHYNCPYQTPPSILIRIAIGYLANGSSTFARSLRPCMASLASVCSGFTKKLRQTLRYLRSGVRGALQELGCVPGSPDTVPIPLAIVESPIWFLGEIYIDWEVCKADTRCISWILDSTTDSDVIFCASRLAADMILYPEIANALSPRTLATLFLECLLDGRVIPGKLEHASVIGMALASVLSIQLCTEPEREDLQRLGDSIHPYANWVSESEPTLLPGVAVLRIVLETPERVWDGRFRKLGIFSNVSGYLPTSQKLCLTRVILQTIWRWRRIQDPPAVFNLEAIDLFCKGLMENGDHILPTLKINCFLIMAISLGYQAADVRALFTPNNDDALRTAINLFHYQLQASIGKGSIDQHYLTLVLSASIHLDPFRSRSSALRVFHRFMSGWFSSRMETIPGKDLDDLLQAVGDPFQFTLDPSLYDGQPVFTADYEPMMAAVLLIEFASSDLWRDHLRLSNFTSCEGVMSTEEGRRAALRCMFHTATRPLPEFLSTPTKIIAAIRCLEGLQCLNIAEVVITWAWTAGVINPVDHDAWGLVGRDTLRFYQTHGLGRLTALKRHIIDTTMEDEHLAFLKARCGGTPCRVRSVLQPVPTTDASQSEHYTDLRLSQVCQLKKIYHLFSYDPTTWKEGVTLEEGDETVNVSLGASVIPMSLVDWACDYP